ncbi:MAG: hypothetical protein IH899_19380 [Planctomycetes bacterium]|nr:hypothetical protein [Planctomycetota bacterium]
MKANYSEFFQFDEGNAVKVVTRTAEFYGNIISNKHITERLDLRMRQSSRIFKYAEIRQIVPTH